MSLPDTVARFVADTTSFTRPVDQAARRAGEFGRATERASLTARKALLAAGEAADKAAASQRAAAEAAEKLAKGEIKEAEAARLAAAATRDLERANIAEREASVAAARAADQAADQYRQLARDAELAAAAQQLAALRAAGAVRQHNALLRDLSARYGDLSKEGGEAFTLIRTRSMRAAAAIASTGPGAIAAVVAALAAVPFAATAAEAAIGSGLGLALVGVGLAATKSDRDVQIALASMKSHVKATTSEIAAPFKTTWIEIARTAEQTFDSLAPELKRGFAELAPAMTSFVHDTGLAVRQLEPAFRASSHAATELLGAVGSRLPEISGNFGHSIEILADGADRAAPALANITVAVSQMLPPMAAAIDTMVRFGSAGSIIFDVVSHGATTLSAWRDGLSMATGGLISAGHGFDVAAGSFRGFDEQAGSATASTLGLKTAQDLAALSAKDLAAATQQLAGANMSADAAAIAQAQATRAAAKAADHRRGLSLGEKSALLGVAQADQQLIQKMKEAGASSEALSGKMRSLRSDFIAQARQMGLTGDQARRLADRYGLLPSRKDTKISAPGASAAAAAAAGVRRAVNSIPSSHTIAIRAIVTGATLGQILGSRGATGGLYTGRDFRYAAGGEVSGLVSGPGTGTSDEVPAPWLSDGEFVVREKTTRENTAALMALNAGLSWMQAARYAPGEGLARGGRYAGPGRVLVGEPSEPTGARAGLGPGLRARDRRDFRRFREQERADARLALARSRPEYLAALAAQQSLERMRSSVYGGFFAGGASTIGSSHGTVVQHVTNVNVHVAGSVRSDRELLAVIQQQLLRGRVQTSLPEGR